SESHVVWENPRGVPFVPSAILVDDFYYLINDEGIATCLDAKTGQRIWQKRLPGRYTASPIATREHVYFCNEDGETLVVEAGEKRYRQVARNRLDQPIFASPAIAHGSVFIRTSETLLCIGGE
ncbi:MAG TPA: serine/threonine protein kinase, partial [Planctomycetaceae bacterium]|nr:serine/threonine protein kinase [Planctomycetaceae bacterium]